MSLVSKSPTSPNKHTAHATTTKSVTWSVDSYDSDEQLSQLRKQLRDIQQENISLLRELVNVRKDMNQLLEGSLEEQRLHLIGSDELRASG